MNIQAQFWTGTFMIATGIVWIGLDTKAAYVIPMLMMIAGGVILGRMLR